MRRFPEICFMFAALLILNTRTVSAQVNPTFTWSPLDPGIGERVLFTIDGVAGSFDKATWTMGGVGCDGESSTQICTPTLFNDCRAMAFEYATSGAKIVGLSIEIDGDTYTDERPAAFRTIAVGSSGICGGTIEPYISWQPASPSIGETIIFSVEGVGANVDIDIANWNMGGPGCEGASHLQTCLGNFSEDCRDLAYKYASSGTKIVSLSIVVDGITYSDDRPSEDRTLAVAPSGNCIVCSNQLSEPGFEGGSGSAWSESSSHGYYLITMNRPRTGLFSAWLGGAVNEQSSVWQTPMIDPTAIQATLSYWYWIEKPDGTECGNGGVMINGVPARGHEYPLCSIDNTGAFIESDIVDLLPYAGTAPEIRFYVNTYGGTSSLYVDDVVLEVCAPNNSVFGVFTDGFESGDTSAWSVAFPAPG